MKINNFELFALLLASCLFGVIISAYFNHGVVTHREMALVFGFYISALMTFFARENNNQAIASYLSRHTAEVEVKQCADLKDACRRRINALNSEHSVELRRIHGNLNTANGQVDRVNNEYNWVCAQYQEQLRVNQELQDRLNYLENERKQNGLSSPAQRLPFSAPASQIQFSDPRARARFSSAKKSPLDQVLEAEEE